MSKTSIWYYFLKLDDFSLAGYEAFLYLTMVLVATSKCILSKPQLWTPCNTRSTNKDQLFQK